MAGNILNIELTKEQQNQIKAATGKSIKKLHIDVAAAGDLSDTDLDAVAGGWFMKPWPIESTD